MVLGAKGDHDGAAKLYRESLAIRGKVLGGEHSKVYQVGKEKGDLTVSVHYDTTDPDAQDAFSAYFGFGSETVRIGNLQASSNELSLQRKR